MIFNIARGIGTPLTLDDCTMQKSRSLYVRVHVDIDMLSNLFNKILVEELHLPSLHMYNMRDFIPFILPIKF